MEKNEVFIGAFFRAGKLMFSSTKTTPPTGDPAMRITARPDCSPKNADPFITDNRKHMTEQDTNHKGGRPKAIKGKARTKTISTRLTLAEWKTVMKRIADAGKKPSHFLRELLLQGKVVAARTQKDRQQIRMLEGGCNNLNQLAKLAHQQGFPRTKEKIIVLLDEFNKIIEKI